MLLLDLLFVFVSYSLAFGSVGKDVKCSLIRWSKSSLVLALLSSEKVLSRASCLRYAPVGEQFDTNRHDLRLFASSLSPSLARSFVRLLSRSHCYCQFSIRRIALAPTPVARTREGQTLIARPAAGLTRARLSPLGSARQLDQYAHLTEFRPARASGQPPAPPAVARVDKCCTHREVSCNNIDNEIANNCSRRAGARVREAVVVSRAASLKSRRASQVAASLERASLALQGAHTTFTHSAIPECERLADGGGGDAADDYCR